MKSSTDKNSIRIRRGRSTNHIVNHTSKRDKPLSAGATWNMRGVEIVSALDEMARTCARDAQRLELIGEWDRAGKAERLAGQLAVLAAEAREVFAEDASPADAFVEDRSDEERTSPKRHD